MSFAKALLALPCAVLVAGGCSAPPGSPPDASKPPPSADAAAAVEAEDAGAPVDNDAGRAPADAGVEPEPDAASSASDAGQQPSCDPHSVTGTPRFTDATEAWGLGHSGLNVVGNRIIAADLDQDGYPDLVVHAIYSNAREQVGSATRRVWVLMNRPRPGGEAGRRFVDATLESGVFAVEGSTTELRSAQLAIAGDVDNDGDLDLFSGTYVDPGKPEPGDRSTVMLNDGTGHFVAAAASDPSGPAQPTTGATFLDYNRDGKLDLFVGFFYAGDDYGYQHELYRGRGDGLFGRATGPAGLMMIDSGTAESIKLGQNPRPAYGVTSCDVDGNGAPDLMVSAYGREWNLLYLNRGVGLFREVGQTSGFAGDADLDYHDNQMFLCWCESHPSEPDCAGAAPPMISCENAYWQPGRDDHPYRLNGNTFTTVCADLTGDGNLDLYNAEIRHWWTGGSSDASELLVSSSIPGRAVFERPGNAATGLVWPHPTVDWNEGGLMAAAADLDNDARPDLLVAASDYPDQFGLLFHQKPDGTFHSAGQQWGLHHACMSGLTVADFDRDGDLDVVVGSGTARDCSAIWSANEVHLYENDASSKGRWLAIRLAGDGATANRSGIGARVTVTAGGVAQVQELGGGYGHMGMQNDLVLFFGLGGCAQVESVAVRWPDASGTTETWTGVAAGRMVELRQGDPAVYDVTPGQ